MTLGTEGEASIVAAKKLSLTGAEVAIAGGTVAVTGGAVQIRGGTLCDIKATTVTIN